MESYAWSIGRKRVAKDKRELGLVPALQRNESGYGKKNCIKQLGQRNRTTLMKAKVTE